MHQLDKSSLLPAPIDRITLNLAAEPLSRNLVPGDKLGPVANSPEAASVEDDASVGPRNGTPTDDDKAKSHPIDDMPIVAMPIDAASGPSVGNLLGNPVLPSFQDTTEDKAVPTLPTEFRSPATTLKRRLENTKDLIVCPGVYDGFSARIALSVGFDAMYMVGNLYPRILTQAF